MSNLHSIAHENERRISHLPNFPTSRDDRLAALQEYIVSVIHHPMTPAEFCQKWVKHPLTSQKYAKECDRVLAHATGLRESDVTKWGSSYRKYPLYIPVVLRLADIIRELQALGLCRAQSHPWSIDSLGVDFSVRNRVILKFAFGESVTADGEFGTIAGMVYLDREWHCIIKLHPDSPSAQVKPILQVPQSKVSRW